MKGGGCSGGDGDGGDGGGAEFINRKFMRDVHSVLESFFFSGVPNVRTGVFFFSLRTGVQAF